MEDDAHALLGKFSKDVKTVNDYEEFYIQTVNVLELCDNMLQSEARFHNLV